MNTVADTLSEWNGGGTLRAPSSETTDSSLGFGPIFVVGLLVASAVGAAIEFRRRA